MPFDQKLFLLLNSLGQPWLDYPVAIFSFLGRSYCLIGAVSLFLICAKTVQAIKKIGLFTGMILLLSLVIESLKYLIKRPRPFSHFSAEIVEGSVRLVDIFGQPTSYSFPSGHACMAFATAVFLTHYLGRRWWPLYLWAVLMALSRIYLGFHYPLDVLAGGIIGVFLGWGFVSLTKPRGEARSF